MACPLPGATHISRPCCEVTPTSPARQVIIDTANPSAPEKRPIKADSAIMCPGPGRIIALKAAVPGVEGDNLQVRGCWRLHGQQPTAAATPVLLR